jgi:hypothetical protein
VQAGRSKLNSEQVSSFARGFFRLAPKATEADNAHTHKTIFGPINNHKKLRGGGLVLGWEKGGIIIIIKSEKEEEGKVI